MSDPAIKQLQAFNVLGTQERINPMQADWGAIWGRFEARMEETKALYSADEGIGVYFDSGEEGLADHLAGMPAGVVDPVPAGMTLREVPGGAYAVFECAMGDIGATWQGAFHWLAASAYVNDEARPCFERFPPGCHEGTASVEICLPVKAKG